MRYFLLLFLCACSGPYSGACQSFSSSYCDTCELSDAEKTWCKCLEEGELSGSDFEGDKVSDDDAMLRCDAFLEVVHNPTPEEATSCQQSVTLLEEHDQDACDYVISVSTLSIF